MYRGKYLTSRDEASLIAVDLRKGIPEFPDGRDEWDQMAFYAVCFDENDVPAGTGRLYIDADSHFRIDRLGVVPEKRGMYIGDLLARMLLYKAQELNAAGICITCPSDTVRFFARYGFTLFGSENGLADMSVTADAIRLEGSCSRNKGAACPGNCESCQA